MLHQASSSPRLLAILLNISSRSIALSSLNAVSFESSYELLGAISLTASGILGTPSPLSVIKIDLTFELALKKPCSTITNYIFRCILFRVLVLNMSHVFIVHAHCNRSSFNNPIWMIGDHTNRTFLITDINIKIVHVMLLVTMEL